jgi:hypothetical protein
MSTFYGGPQLVSVTQINLYRESFGGSGSISYTVPVGHFAVVSCSITASGGNFAAGNVTVRIGAVYIKDEEVVLPSMTVTQGSILSGSIAIGLQQIQIGVHIGIQVYKNP